MTLKQIASEVKGIIVGDSSIIITSVDDINGDGNPQGWEYTITFGQTY